MVSERLLLKFLNMFEIRPLVAGNQNCKYFRFTLHSNTELQPGLLRIESTRFPVHTNTSKVLETRVDLDPGLIQINLGRSCVRMGCKSSVAQCIPTCTQLASWKTDLPLTAGLPAPQSHTPCSVNIFCFVTCL